MIGALTSPVMSNTARAAMMLPIALGVMGVVGGMVAKQAEGEHRVERLRFGSALMLVITYSITVGGLLLPIGSPPNLIGRSLLEEETGEPITFFEWFVMALPIVVVMFVAVIVICLLFNRPEVKQVDGVEEYVAKERGSHGGLSRGEKSTLLVLAFCARRLVPPRAGRNRRRDDSDVYTQVSEASNEGIVAILAAGLLFSESLGVSSLVGVTIVVVGVAVLVSETPATRQARRSWCRSPSRSRHPPTSTRPSRLWPRSSGPTTASCCRSDPANAIVYSSGMLPITRMIKAGAVFDIIGIVLCVTGVITMAN
ncbi:MAG: SLC13 family permease, partial [Thermoleophilaceae bacterium]